MSIDISLILNLFIITFLLLLNAFFVAAEFALVGVRKTRILQLSNEGNFDAKLALDAVKTLTDISQPSNSGLQYPAWV